MSKLSDYIFSHRNEFMSGLAMDYVAGQAKELEQELEAKDKEIKKWQKEALQQYPTPEAYQAVCDALEANKKEIAELKETVNDRMSAQVSQAAAITTLQRTILALKANYKSMHESFQIGYEQGHEATVEGYYNPEEAADDYIEDLTNKDSVRIKGVDNE